MSSDTSTTLPVKAPENEWLGLPLSFPFGALNGRFSGAKTWLLNVSRSVSWTKKLQGEALECCLGSEDSWDSGKGGVPGEQCSVGAPGWLFDIGDEILPNYMGNIS